MLYRFAAPAMACRFEVVLESTDAARARAVAEEALAEVTLWHKRLNRFDSASDITRINRLAPTQPVRVDSELFELLSLCQTATRLTQGMFSPLLKNTDPRTTAIPCGVLVGPADPVCFEVPDNVQRRTPPATAVPSKPSLLLDNAALTVQFTDPDSNAALDLGGIAKGWALDRAADSLIENGVTLALLHGGTSSVRAVGIPPGATGWAIQVADNAAATPSAAAAERLVLHLANESLSISAHYGRPGGHITHPATGQLIHPSQHAGPTIAVATCRSAAWAEVWSTALLLDPTLSAQGQQIAPHQQARFAAVRNTCAWNVCSGCVVCSSPSGIPNPVTLAELQSI